MKLTVNEFSELLQVSNKQHLKQQLKNESEIAGLKHNLKACYEIINLIAMNKITRCTICKYRNADESKCMKSECEFKWDYADEIERKINND